MIANGNRNNQRNTSIKDNKDERDFKEAISILENYNKKVNKNEISSNEINNLLKNLIRKRILLKN